MILPSFISQSNKLMFSYFILTTKHRVALVLTLGLVVLAWRTPAYAGPVLVQIEEAVQAFLLALQFDHLTAALHGAHAPLNCKEEATEERRPWVTLNIDLSRTYTRTHGALVLWWFISVLMSLQRFCEGTFKKKMLYYLHLVMFLLFVQQISILWGKHNEMKKKVDRR